MNAPPKNIRHAAVVILCRAKGDTISSLYLVRRATTLRFLGGFDAFLGGSVEDSDLEEKEWGRYRNAALRELEEETGIHWSNKEAMTPMGQWLTPDYLPIRFLAHFFAIVLPQEIKPNLVGDEHSEGRWVNPIDALKQHNNGELKMSFPVLETMKLIVDNGYSLKKSAKNAAKRKKTHPFYGGEIIRGLHIVPLKTPTLPPATHTNCYIIGNKKLVIIDPASPYPQEQEKLLSYLGHLKTRGMHASEIWLSHHHPDHVGGVTALQKSLNLPIAAHQKTAEQLSGLTIDRYLNDGDNHQVEFNDNNKKNTASAQWEILHTPGHDQGHLCFFEKNAKTLLSSDNVVGVGSVVIAEPDGHMGAYMASLKRLKSLKAELMFSSHGPPHAMPSQKIQDFIDHRIARETLVVDSLNAARNKQKTLFEILPEVYIGTPKELYPLAQKSLLAHLNWLIQKGIVIKNHDGYCLSKAIKKDKVKKI